MEEKCLGDCASSGSSQPRRDGVILVGLVVVVGLVLATAVGLFRWKIGGALSTSADDWSYFGSYIGGVLGPLISFFTLIAIAITIRLQRQLLIAQQEQFSKLHALQVATFDSQANQAREMMLDAAYAKLSAKKSSLIQSIDRLSLSTIRDIQLLEVTKESSIDSLKQCKTLEEVDSVKNGVSTLARRIEVLESRRIKLDALLLTFTLTEHKSEQALQSHFHEGVQDSYSEKS